MTLRISVALAASLAVAGLCSSAAHADTFTTVVVYGDSLSDNGNLYKLTGGLAPLSPPYFQGRFSNGPVAVEQLAAGYGANLVDFAYGGATTGIGNEGDGGTQTSFGAFHLPGIATEFAGSQTAIAPLLNPNTLFVVWGGANDFLAAGSPAVAASNIDNIVRSLEVGGATHILVPGTPDLGLTPEFYGNAIATAYSEAFNTLLQASLPAGATYVDTFNLLHTIATNGAAYGFTNTTDPCVVQTGPTSYSVCSNPSQYLFWDSLHPTTNADAILASNFAAALTPTAATPEPSSLLLTFTGLSGAATLLRRRYRRA